MIAKVTRGSDGGGLVRYLMGPGRAEEHSAQRVIAAADMVVVPTSTVLSAEETGDLGRQLDAAATLYGADVAGGHIWHLALSNPAGDRELSDGEWAEVVVDAMGRLGFTEASGKAPCRWMAVRHGRSAGGHDHVHVAVSLVREDGTKASIWRDQVRLSELCGDAERRLGLTVVDGRKRGGLPGTGRPESEAAQRRGRAEPERATLARLVRGAAVVSADEGEFVRRLRAAGLVVRPRYGTADTREVVGYSVALRPVAGEGPVFFGGGRLARDLALPALRSAWDGAGGSVEEVAAAWGTPGRQGTDKGREGRVLRPAGWANAAVRVELALVDLRAVPVPDGARWAAVARELSGMFGSWSARVEEVPGPLARVADALAWSGQFREPGPWRDRAAVDFRGVAGVIAQAAISSQSGAGWVLLLQQMRRTVEAVEAAHRARGELLQAARLAKLVTVELRQEHVRLERQAALAGERGIDAEAVSCETGPVGIGEMLEVSGPPPSICDPDLLARPPCDRRVVPRDDESLGR